MHIISGGLAWLAAADMGSTQLVDNPADAEVFLPRLLPGLERVSTEVSDPECRGVATAAHTTLLKVGAEGSAQGKLLQGLVQVRQPAPSYFTGMPLRCFAAPCMIAVTRCCIAKATSDGLFCQGCLCSCSFCTAFCLFFKLDTALHCY